MSELEHGFIQDDEEEDKPMLESTEWVRINKSCHTLVDAQNKILACVYTSYDEEDGDENLIWEVEIEDDAFGAYVSLYSAKLAVQKAIAEYERSLAEAESEQKVKKVRKSAKKVTAK